MKTRRLHNLFFWQPFVEQFEVSRWDWWCKWWKGHIMFCSCNPRNNRALFIPFISLNFVLKHPKITNPIKLQESAGPPKVLAGLISDWCVSGLHVIPAEDGFDCTTSDVDTVECNWLQLHSLLASPLCQTDHENILIILWYLYFIGECNRHNM